MYVQAAPLIVVFAVTRHALTVYVWAAAVGVKKCSKLTDVVLVSPVALLRNDPQMFRSVESLQRFR